MSAPDFFASVFWIIMIFGLFGLLIVGIVEIMSGRRD